MLDPAGVDRTPNSNMLLPSYFLDALARSMSVRPFRGILRDIKARGPYYVSDWTDAWNYRVVPATALTFFSK